MKYLWLVLLIPISAMAGDFRAGGAGETAVFDSGLSVTGGDYKKPFIGFIVSNITGIANNGVETIITMTDWNNVQVDTKSGMNPATGVYTVPVGYAGRWKFNFYCDLHQGQLGQMIRWAARLHKNGTVAAEQVFHHMGNQFPNPDAPQAYLNVGIDVLVGDQLDIRVLRREAATGGSYTAGGTDTSCRWSGYYEGKY